MISPYKQPPSVIRNAQERVEATKQKEPPNCPSAPNAEEDLGLNLEQHIQKDVLEEEQRLKADIDLYKQDEHLLTQDEAREEEEDSDDEEGDYINSKIEPPRTIRTYKSLLGELGCAMPHLEHTYKETMPALIKVGRPKLDKTFNTFFHYKDRRYNACLHKIVNGLIREWRRGIHDMCDDLDKMKSLTNCQGYRNQCNYADTTALLI